MKTLKMIIKKLKINQLASFAKDVDFEMINTQLGLAILKNIMKKELDKCIYTMYSIHTLTD